MKSQSDMILEAYQNDFDHLSVEEELDGWVLITGRRKKKGGMKKWKQKTKKKDPVIFEK